MTGEVKNAYPEAKLIAPVEVVDRLKDLKFDGAWGRDSPTTSYGFEDEVHMLIIFNILMIDPLDRQIKACFFSGFKNKDVAFLHVESKVLIEADLLFNLPATEQYSKSSSTPNLPFIRGLSPTSWFHPRMIWSLGVNKEAMRQDARTVASWDFEKIIPCHGDVIEADGKKAWESVYKFYLED
ncbi:hypothetical protein C0989_005582 [Termitomyces sp. Mn162]|nr:hypothetical protein C0989_005582 [Termitomyces sp. Mn162]